MTRPTNSVQLVHRLLHLYSLAVKYHIKLCDVKKDTYKYYDKERLFRNYLEQRNIHDGLCLAVEEIGKSMGAGPYTRGDVAKMVKEAVLWREVYQPQDEYMKQVAESYLYLAPTPITCDFDDVIKKAIAPRIRALQIIYNKLLTN